MNKRKRAGFLSVCLCICLLFCVACSDAGQGYGAAGHFSTSDDSNGAAQTGYVAPVVEETQAGGELANTEEAEHDNRRSSFGLTEENIAARMQQENGRYAYDMLEDELKPLYVELLMIVEQHGEDVKISVADSDVLQYVFQCMFNDHPEIYWIDGYAYTRHMQNGQIAYLTFSGKYLYTQEETRTLQVQIDQYVSQCFSGLAMNASEYEKVRHVYEYLIEHTDYNIQARDNQNILSVFLYGESVCQGYAKATQYLLERLDVSCTMVVGKVSTGEGHAWNLVNVDDAYYYVDTTWGDASYSIDGVAAAENEMPVSYDFLNITTNQLELTHIIDNVVPMPQCISTEANYYIRENLYFSSYDEDHLREIFDNAYAVNAEAVTIKCSDMTVYEQMCEELITGQKIFLFLHAQTTSVVYTVSEEQLTLSFWL